MAEKTTFDLIKKLAVELPMSDANKARALKEKTGFDAFVAIANDKASKEEDDDKELQVAKERRVKTEAPAATGRRAAATESKYKVISE